MGGKRGANLKDPDNCETRVSVIIFMLNIQNANISNMLHLLNIFLCLTHKKILLLWQFKHYSFLYRHFRF